RAVEPCTDVELSLLMRLGNAATQTDGFTSRCANQSYVRARDLATSLDRPDEHLQACSGIAAGLIAAGHGTEAIALLERFGPAELARVKPRGRVDRLVRMAYARMYRGELAQARSHLTEARRELETAPPSGWKVPVLINLALNLAYEGLLSSAHACAHE